MSGWKACVKNEQTKITAQKKYWILPIVAAALIIGVSLLRLIPGNVLYFSMDNYPYTVMSLLSYVALPLLGFMAASDLMAGEEERGELKIELMRPVSRQTVLLGKLIAMILYLAVVLFSLTLIALIVSMAAAGLEAFSIASIIFAAVITLLPVWMICALALMLALFVRTATAGFVFCLLIYGGVSLLGLWLSALANALPTSYMTIFKMILGSQIPWSSLLIGLCILIGYSMIFTAVASLRFEKKQL